ncbi:MAG: hypothetical protein QM784_11565 [Polyangiaceae bacterium]
MSSPVPFDGRLSCSRGDSTVPAGALADVFVGTSVGTAVAEALALSATKFGDGSVAETSGVVTEATAALLMAPVLRSDAPPSASHPAPLAPMVAATNPSLKLALKPTLAKVPDTDELVPNPPWEPADVPDADELASNPP